MNHAINESEDMLSVDGSSMMDEDNIQHHKDLELDKAHAEIERRMSQLMDVDHVFKP